MGDLSQSDAESIVAIERACSTLSLLGCVFVLVTFSLSDAFRQRAINRMVFYATFGNMLTNVATLMTTSYLSNIDSFGCQLQAFLIQVFMQGDAYWALAMAINVYLTFFRKADARSLRKMEIPYFICCYGIPFVLGFTFLFIRNQEMGRPYGDAVIWCWFSAEWEVYRIAAFYAPVWVAIVIAMLIYIRTGREIYRNRKRMLNFSSTNGNGTVTGAEPFSPYEEFSPEYNFKTTVVEQTTEIIQPPAPVARSGAISPPPLKDSNTAYSVTISSNRPGAIQGHRTSFDDVDIDAASGTVTLTNTTINNHHTSHHPRRNPSLRTAATGYTANGGRRARVLSTTQISIAPTVTATISSAHPNLANPTTTNITSNTKSPGGNGNGKSTAADTARARRRNIVESHNAAWSYTKCAILFFAVLLITWIPSSGNRVYSLIHAGEVSRPLFFASAFVLPLQGFWNAIIYMVTSWTACKSFAGYLAGVVGGWWDWVRLRVVHGRRVSLVEVVDLGTGARRRPGELMGLGRGTGTQGGGKRGGGREGMVGMWMGVGRRGEEKEESTSMEDLTAEGRSDRVSPV